MYYSVSDTAEYGGMTRGPRVVDAGAKARMKDILKEIQSGEFAREWIRENEVGKPRLEALRKEHRELLIEKVGAKLRDMMSWIKK